MRHKPNATAAIVYFEGHVDPAEAQSRLLEALKDTECPAAYVKATEYDEQIGGPILYFP